jgi:hypothetical protein
MMMSIFDLAGAAGAAAAGASDIADSSQAFDRAGLRASDVPRRRRSMQVINSEEKYAKHTV